MNLKQLTLVALTVTLSLSITSTARAQVPELDANLAEVSPGEVVRLEDQLMNGLRVVTA